MRAFGFAKAKVTTDGPDAGVDVRGSGAIAQVKYLLAKVGRRDVQLLVGSRDPQMLEKMVFFSRSGYAGPAEHWAQIWGVALFSYDDYGNPFPENKPARALCAAADYYPHVRNSRPTITRKAIAVAALVATGEPVATPALGIWPRLAKETLLTPEGHSMVTQDSALGAVVAWARRCGYTDSHLTADGLIHSSRLVILARYAGEPISMAELVELTQGKSSILKVALSWKGFDRPARAFAKKRPIALIECSVNGKLSGVNVAARELMFE